MIHQVFEAEIDDHLDYKKRDNDGDHTGNREMVTAAKNIKRKYTHLPRF